MPSKVNAQEKLSRRERQIMDLIWAAGQMTAAEVHEKLADAPSYSAVRALLAVMLEKGHLRHEREGRRYVYRPTVAPDKARKHALSRLLATFFEGSATQLVATLLDPKERAVPPAEAARIRKMIAEDESQGGQR